MMNLFNNPLFTMLSSSKNPQQTAMNLLVNNSQNNPMAQNIINMMQSGNTGNIETIARNLCNERGINPDQMFTEAKNKFKF